MKKRTYFCLILPVLLILLVLFSIPAAAADTSGTLPAGQTWNFDPETGTLTISGTGQLPDYPYSSVLQSQAPWKVWADEIKSVVLSEGITHTGACTFHQLKNLTRVTLPSTLTTVGESAFSNAENLKEVIIPASVTEIGSSAFKDCKSLSKITLPEGLLTIGNRAFSGCKSLVSIAIPASVTHIGSSVFLSCDVLQFISIQGAPEIGEACFEKKQLHTICFGGDMPKFHNRTFLSAEAKCYYPQNNATWNTEALNKLSGDCTWVPHEDPGSITFSETTGECGENAIWSFADGTLTISGTGAAEYKRWSHFQKSIENVVIEEGITNVPDYAFQFCSNLKSVKFAASVTSIGDEAFRGCKALTSVVLPENLVSVGYNAFMDCTALASVTLGNKVSELDSFAFCNTAITWIELPDSLVSLGHSVFGGCQNLVELHIPASVQSMGDGIISGCLSLKTVRFYGDLPETTGMNYGKTPAIIYYPKDNPTWADENLPQLSGSFVLVPYTVCSIDGHRYGGWANVKEPTTEEDGLKQRICGVCKEMEYATIPKLDRYPTDSTPATEPTTPATQPSTPPVTQPTTPPTTPTTGTTVPSVTPAPEPSSQATEPSNVADGKEGTTEPQNNATIYILCGILIVGFVGGAVWFILRKRH